MNFRRIIVLLIVAGCCAGCLIPIPHPRIHAYGVKAQIVDAVNGAPVTNAEVAIVVYDTNTNIPTFETSYKKAALTDSQGHFVIRPVYGWHGAYIIGPISLSVLPGWDATFPTKEIRVTAPGYHPRDFVFSTGAWPSSTHQPTFVPIRATISAGYLETEHLPLIPLSKSEAHSLNP